MAELAPALLDRPGGPVVVDHRLGQVGQLVGAVDLPIGRGGVHEHQIKIEVQERGDGGEDLAGDLAQRVEQEVHPPVGGVVGEPRAAVDRDPFGHPPGAGQLRPRFQRPLGDQREQHPLGRLAVQPPTGGDAADRGADAEPFPDPVQRPRPTQVAGVEHLHLRPGRRAGRLLRGEEPRDRGHQPALRLAVHPLRPPKLWITLATELPVCGCRSLCASCR